MGFIFTETNFLMTDNTGTSAATAPQTQEPGQQAPVVDPARQELDRLMNIQMTARIPADQSNTQQQDQNQQADAAAAQPEPGAQPAAITDAFQVLKEKYGYDTIETAVKEIEDLRQFKAAPPVSAIKYENELSEKVAKALQAGNLKEVYQVLDQQERLAELTTVEVTKDSAEKILKTAISIKNPTLSPHEVDFQYKNEYVAPKEPVQKATEDDEDFAERHNEWKERVEFIETKRVIAAKMAQPELESAKSKIVFPEVAASVDEGYLQYKKSLEEQPQIEAAMKEIYKPLTPKSIETKIKFIDEPNKIDFEFQHEPDVQGFEKAKEMALDSSKFLALFTLPNGDFDNAKYLDALYFAANKEAVLLEAIKQAKNATIKASLPDNSGGAQRQFPQSQQLGELDQAMINAGIKKAS